MRARRYLAAMLAALIGCGGGENPVQPPPPPPPPPPLPVMISIYLTGNSDVRGPEGGKINFRAMGRFDSGLEREVTSQCEWGATPELLRFLQPGVGTARYSGVAVVSAKCGSFRDSLSVNVRLDGDVPRNAFPQVTPEEWEFVRTTMVFPAERTRRVEGPVVRLWAQAGIHLEEVLEGHRLIGQAVGLRFEAAPDSASADWRYVLGDLPGDHAGQPYLTLTDYAITAVTVVMDSVKIRNSSSEVRRMVYAHEAGHSVGVGHYEGGCDIMNTTTCHQYVVSGFMGRVYGVMYSVPPGTRFY